MPIKKQMPSAPILNTSFKGGNSGGYYDRAKLENPLNFDRTGEPIDEDYPDEDHDMSVQASFIDI